MRTFLNKHKFGTVCSVFVCLILCFTIIALSVVPVMAGGLINNGQGGTEEQGNIYDNAWNHGKDQIDDDKQESDLSLGDVASCAAWFMNWRFSKAKSEDNTDYVDLWSESSSQWANNVGMAGAYVGFVKSGGEATDKADTGSFLGVRFTKANVSYSFNTFYNNTRTTGGSGISLNSRPLRNYLYYGSVLKQLGIDKYGSANGSFVTVVGGGLTYGLYAAAAVVPKLLNLFIDALQLLNPFGMLASSKELGGSGNLSVTNTSDNANENAFESFRQWYGGLVDAIAGITWAILIPLCIVSIIVTLLLFRKTDLAKTRYRKLSMRIIFLAIGIPLLGALYTGMLREMSEVTKQPLNAADEAVVSTYVDFGSWAMKNNLQPPEARSFRFTILSDNNDGEPSPTSLGYWNLKYYAMYINNDVAGIADFNTSDYYVSQADGSRVSEWTTSSVQENENDDDNRNAAGLNGDVMDLLARYISGSVITAGDYGSAMVGEYANKKVAVVMLHDMDTYDEWKKFKDEDNNQIAQFLRNPNATDVRSPMNNGWMDINDSEGPAHSGSEGLGFDPSDNNPNGLSDVAMYNYLNSEFTSTGCNVFGANETVSIFSQNYHRRVNVVGTGFLSFAFWFNCICTLLAYAVVGWFYAFGMLFQNIKRTFMVLTKIPIAALGVMRSMAQVVAYAIIMLVEVFGTIFMYAIVMSMLQTIPKVIMDTIINILSTDSGTSSGGLTAYLFLASFVLIFLMIKSLSLRKTILKGIDEGVNSIIARIFGTDGQLTPEANANINGGQHALRNGMIAGAGMAMANRMLSPNKDGAGADGKDGEGADGEDGASGSNGSDGGSGRNAAASADGKDGSGQGFDTSDFGEGKDAKDEENKGRMAALRDSLAGGSDGSRMSDRIKRKAVGAQDAADAKHAAKQNAKFGYAMDENGNIDRSKLSRGDRAKFDAGNALHKARGEGRALSAQARGAVTDKAGDAKSAAKRGAIATRDAAVGAGKSVAGAAQAGGQHLKVGSAISSANRASKTAYKQAINNGASQSEAQQAASVARAKTLKAAGVTETMVREHNVKMKGVMKQGAAQARGNTSVPKSIKGSTSSATVTDEAKVNRKSVVKQGAVQTNVQPQGNNKATTLKGSNQRATKIDTVKVDTKTNVRKGQNQVNGAAAFMGGMAMASMMDGANKDTTRHVKSKNTIIYDAENVGRKGVERTSGYRPSNSGSGVRYEQGSNSRKVIKNRMSFDSVTTGSKGQDRQSGYTGKHAVSTTGEEVVERSTRRRNQKGNLRHDRK